jgi:hypothetical protein
MANDPMGFGPLNMVQSALGGGGGGGGLGGLASTALSFMSGPWGPLIGGALNLFGQNKSMDILKDTQDTLMNLPGMQGPSNLMGDFGSSVDGQQAFNQQTRNALSGLDATMPGLFGGQMANPLLQMGLGGLGSAVQGAQNAFNTNIGPMNAGSLGAAGGLMQQGLANMASAGDQSALYNQSLQNMREMYAPEQQRQQNQLFDALASKGLLGAKTDVSSGNTMQRNYFDAQAQADRGFQDAAFNRAQAEATRLGNLGMGQFGQGLGAEAQAFRQALGSNQAAQQAALQNAGLFQGLYGMGGDIFGQNYGLGLGGMDALLGMNRFGLDMAAMPYQLQADLLKGSGYHADAQAMLGKQMADSSGGFFSSLGGLFG